MLTIKEITIDTSFSVFPLKSPKVRLRFKHTNDQEDTYTFDKVEAENLINALQLGLEASKLGLETTSIKEPIKPEPLQPQIIPEGGKSFLTLSKIPPKKGQ